MATLRLTLTLRVDDVLHPSFPLERTITGTEAEVFDRVLPSNTYTNTTYGLAGFATLLHFSAGAEVKPDDDSPQACTLLGESVYLNTKSGVTMAFVTSTTSRVRGLF